MPYRDYFPPCPRCNKALEELVVVTGHKILSCSECDGNWTTPDVFKAIAMALIEDSRPPEIEPRDDGTPHLACPVCRRNMTQVAVGAAAVDQCTAHGAWFDFGELQTVLTTMAD